MNSKTKKLLASIAALQILLYHCWIPVFRYGTFWGSAERFLIATTYPGVDLFFFLSAFSLVSRPVDNYRSFLINRSVKLLPLFFIAWISGQFLWFIPSIMILYLVLPLLYPICRKKPVLSFFLLMIGWVGIVYLFLGLIRPSQDLGIFLFRIPSIILGAYAVGTKDKLSTRTKILGGILLMIGGMLLMYRFGYIRKLNVPFRSTFYLTGIPSTLGTVLLVDGIMERSNAKSKDQQVLQEAASPSKGSGLLRNPGLIERFGSMTLELYFAQMVFGTFLISLFFRMSGSKLVTNLLSLLLIILISALIKQINDWFVKKVQSIVNGKVVK